MIPLPLKQSIPPTLLKQYIASCERVTKAKGAFTFDQALLKLMYLIIKDICEKWTMPIHNWAYSQLYIKFGDRILKDQVFEKH